jgi:DNA-binding GntR family transcriptional regulator
MSSALRSAGQSSPAADHEPLLPLDAPPESLSDFVYERIREAIVKRMLPPGSRVTEASLAASLNVSKTPVREALLKLRQVGLIEPVGRRGGRIVMPSRESISYAYETREALEVFAAERASERATQEERALVVACADRCLSAAEAGDVAQYRHWDSAFHDAVAEAAHNPQLTELIENSFALVMTLRSRDVPHAQAHIECARAHVAIAKSIARGKADAGERMRAHVRQVATYVLESVDEEELEAQSAAAQA